MVLQHLELLGKKAKDAVTGYEGVIDSVSFDLYGCVTATIKPPVDKKGEIPQGSWFDVSRLVILDDNPVMNIPDFNQGYIAEGRKGAAIKPMR